MIDLIFLLCISTCAWLVWTRQSEMPLPDFHWYSCILKFLTSFILITYIVILIIIINGCYLYKKEATEDDIASKLKKYSMLFRSETAQVCSICMENFCIKEVVVKIECTHIFHFECLKGWLKIDKTSCPMCRKNLEFWLITLKTISVLIGVSQGGSKFWLSRVFVVLNHTV